MIQNLPFQLLSQEKLRTIRPQVLVERSFLEGQRWQYLPHARCQRILDWSTFALPHSRINLPPMPSWTLQDKDMERVVVMLLYSSRRVLVLMYCILASMDATTDNTPATTQHRRAIWALDFQEYEQQPLWDTCYSIGSKSIFIYIYNTIYICIHITWQMYTYNLL